MDGKNTTLRRKNIYNLARSMQSSKVEASLTIERPVYTFEELNETTEYEKTKIKRRDLWKHAIKSFSLLNLLRQRIPIIQWLYLYNWKKNILGDILSGFTVGIMNISQGMGLALLGNVPPVVGIYMAFLPALVYSIFGTSRHGSFVLSAYGGNSILHTAASRSEAFLFTGQGTFAVICLMTGSIVEKHTNAKKMYNGTIISILNTDNNEELFTNIDIATAVCFVVACYEMCMFILNLGIMVNLFSEPLISSFTCGAAVHVCTSQLKELFGLSIKQRSQNFKVYLTLKDIILSIHRSNVVTVGISLTYLTILFFHQFYLKPFVAKRTVFPVPMELIAIVTGTIISYSLDLNKTYGVKIIKHIPKGLPTPSFPPINAIKNVMIESIAVTMVSFAVTISMILFLAQKGHYEVQPNQELFALSMTNLVGSLFSCIPISVSLSRSLIQFNLGGSTQIASWVSCLLLFFVLFWIGPVFEPLPLCILSSIIVTALTGMFRQLKDCKTSWLKNKWDFLTWIVSFGVTVIVDVPIGLIAGLSVNILTLSARIYFSNHYVLGNVPNTDLYLSVKHRSKVIEFEGIKIFRFSSGIHFLSRLRFRESLFKDVQVNPIKIIEQQKHKKKTEEEIENVNVYCIIIDMSLVTFVDPSGLSMLHRCKNEYETIGIQVYLTNLSDEVFEAIRKCDKVDGFIKNENIFATIHDAVIIAQALKK